MGANRDSSSSPARPKRVAAVAPRATRDVEIAMAQKWGTVVGVDEVGRGALAGPVGVGMVAVTAQMGPQPEDLTDSKLLTPRRRTELVAPIKEWALAAAVGEASAAEIDEIGLTAALRLAGWRALEEVNRQLNRSQAEPVGAVLLDGVQDWFTPPEPTLWDTVPSEERAKYPVVTRVKADIECSAVAAASILAKVHRDTFMEQLSDPGYDWTRNKGYGSPTHLEALATMGASDWHRKSWKLPKHHGGR